MITQDRLKRWGAQINASGIAYRLGYFACPKAAHQIYVEAARRFHGEFANPGV